MNYFDLFKNTEAQSARVGIIGANGGFGYSFLAQIPLMQGICLRAICDLNSNESIRVLSSLGYDEQDFVICSSYEDIKSCQGKPEAIIILENGELLPFCDIDVMVESTGVPEISALVAEKCLLQNIHVCMVSKETDSVVGPYLQELACRQGVIYTMVNGDQPANLIQLFSWAKTLGLEIIAAGKSSEYDFVYDPESKEFSYLGKTNQIPSLSKEWYLNGMDTLANRSRILVDYPQSAVPDYCEMNVVSNATGLHPSCDKFHYPICRVEELADVFIPWEDGGILQQIGVVDVFINLRRPDEASFAGGVFVIVKCHNTRVWGLLKEKGHVVSHNGKYACMYLPYHFMGVEAPLSVLLAFRLALSSSKGCKRNSIMTGCTLRDFHKGELLAMHGHHHFIEGLEVSLVPYDQTTSNFVPFYLAAGKYLSQDVPKGSLLTFEMIDFTDSNLSRMYSEI